MHAYLSRTDLKQEEIRQPRRDVIATRNEHVYSCIDIDTWLASI